MAIVRNRSQFDAIYNIKTRSVFSECESKCQLFQRCRENTSWYQEAMGLCKNNKRIFVTEKDIQKNDKSYVYR